MHRYLHIPYCTGKCHYCAFHSGLAPAHPERLVDDFVREAETRGLALGPVETLYCGGGTPGLLGVKGFQRLAEVGLARLVPGGEWTVELHPATVEEHLLATLAELGVTRISIGVQAFNDATLERCNRRHTVAQAREAIRCAKRFVADTGIDLIAGLPGVTREEWRATVEAALAFDLSHLSIYALSIDEGSLWARQGMSPPDAEAVCDAIAEAEVALGAQGLLRYETSNYARPGFECRHNLNTWQGGDYVGFGRGAVSRCGLRRRMGDGTEETLSPQEDALERALTQLRLREGFDLEAVLQRYPLLSGAREAWAQLLVRFRQYGFLTEANGPTTRGYEVLDAMERELLAAVE